MRLTNSLLQEALTAILDKYDDGTNEHAAIMDGLDQLKELEQLIKDDGLWNDEVSVISSGANCDIVSMMYYDDYGKLKRANGTVTFEMFQKYVRKSFVVSDGNYYPTTLLQDGYDFLSDLWADNEALGDNKPDGSFRRS